MAALSGHRYKSFLATEENERAREAWKSLASIAHGSGRPSTAPAKSSRARALQSFPPSPSSRDLLAPLQKPSCQGRPSTSPAGQYAPLLQRKKSLVGNRKRKKFGLVERLHILRTNQHERKELMGRVQQIKAQRNRAVPAARTNLKEYWADIPAIITKHQKFCNYHEEAMKRRAEIKRALEARRLAQSEEMRRIARAAEKAKREARLAILARQLLMLSAVSAGCTATILHNIILAKQFEKEQDIAARAIQQSVRRYIRVRSRLRVVNAFGTLGRTLARRAAAWAAHRLGNEAEVLKSVLHAVHAWNKGTHGLLQLRLAMGRISVMKRAATCLQNWWRRRWHCIISSCTLAEIQWVILEASEPAQSCAKGDVVWSALEKQLAIDTGVPSEIRWKVIRGFLHGRRLRQTAKLRRYADEVVRRLVDGCDPHGKKNLLSRRPIISWVLAGSEVRAMVSLGREYVHQLLTLWNPQLPTTFMLELRDPGPLASRVSREFDDS
jgi:hypothetical protein